ncbi:glycosyltransferase family 2 protein [Flavobacterium silvaticum]|uniref:Glycosyltransferase n=1 Tax=Flavobacterium silvaticum TaxID=1852020 RepID=A0A972FPZ2_9FLAO|nr:glycosyltransferase family 2 protein [Flavobacterium silvaticum]NMH29230.1 glycosyltransferase [Flavobacterium silvaticum]
MKPFPSSTLITPTYNWPEALELLLLSVRNQTVLPDEVIVADDGSREETSLLIKQFQQDFPVPLIHIFHEDHGNRKPAIMNKALAQAKGDYIIEIDGDIIMQPNFVEDHLTFAEPGLYLFGSRVTINKEKLPELFAKKLIEFNFFSSHISKRTRALRMPWFMLFEERIDKKSSKLRGCNMSFWRKDVIEVNGFNEGLTGWGQDDSELIQRLHNIGIKGRRLKHCGIAFHIYHKEQSKTHVAHNHAIENEITLNKVKFIEKGVSQYL